MTLTSAEVLALAVPLAGAVMAGLMAWHTRASVLRRRRRLKAERAMQEASRASDELVEIKPEALVSIQRDEQQRLYIRAGSLRTLAARINS